MADVTKKRKAIDVQQESSQPSEEDLNKLQRYVFTHSRFLLRNEIIQVDWNRLHSIQPSPFNFQLWNEYNIPSYLSLRDFLHLQLVCRDAATLSRLPMLGEIVIGERSWSELCRVIAWQKREVTLLPYLELKCGDDTRNKKVLDFLASGVGVDDLSVTVEGEHFPLEFTRLPPLVTDLYANDVPTSILTQWCKDKSVKVISLFTSFGSDHQEPVILSWPLKSWTCCFFGVEPPIDLLDDTQLTDLTVNICDYVDHPFSRIYKWMKHAKEVTLHCCIEDLHNILQNFPCVIKTIDCFVLDIDDTKCEYLYTIMPHIVKWLPSVRKMRVSKHLKWQANEFPNITISHIKPRKKV